MINIIVNGKETQFMEDQNLTDLIRHFNLDSRWVIVELNGEAILRENYSMKQIQDGDKIEMVRPVAGG